MTKYEKTIILGLFLFIIGFLLVFKSVTLVRAGHQVVVTRLGAVKEQTLSPGLHFINPIIDKAHDFDVREQKNQVDSDSASKDLQSVNTTIALNYHLDSKNINKLYQEVGRQYKIRIIDPAIQESVKAATANFTAEQLITKRSDVKKITKEILSNRLNERYIILDDLSIVNFSFSNEFDKAIEAKQTAEQNALKAKNDLDRVKLEAEQKVAQAQAEAEALRLQKENVSNELIELRKVEAQKKYIDKWNGQLPQYMGLSNPIIDLTKPVE